MSESHQDKTNHNPATTEDVEWVLSKKSKLLVPKRKNRSKGWTGFSGKTLWDWLQLLIVPIVLAGGGYLFGTWQHNVDQQQAQDQQQATTLQTYIDNIQDLLLNHNLLKSKRDDDVAILARARTLTALPGLDPGRKRRLLTFLYEAKLIHFGDAHGKTHDPIIDLSDANFSGADLSGADFREAILSGADLSDAVFRDANFSGADLSGAFLSRADLHHANFSGADLSGAFLARAGLDDADLSGADLRNAIFGEAILSGANFRNANFRNA